MQELTERQQEVRRLKAEGKKRTEIATLLSISVSRVTKILQQLEVKESSPPRLITDTKARIYLRGAAWELWGREFEDSLEFLRLLAQVPVSKLKRYRKVGPITVANIARDLKTAGVIESEEAWLTHRSEAYVLITNARAIRPLEVAKIFKGDAQDLERLVSMTKEELQATGMGMRTIREVAEALEAAGKIQSAADWLKRKAAITEIAGGGF